MALECFADCMMSQQTLMLAYIEGRKDATRRMSKHAGFSAAMLYNTVVMARATMPIPAAQLSIFQRALTFVGATSAPVQAAFSPVTVGIAFAVTIYGVVQLFRTGEERRDLEEKIQELNNGTDSSLLVPYYTPTHSKRITANKLPI